MAAMTAANLAELACSSKRGTASSFKLRGTCTSKLFANEPCDCCCLSSSPFSLLVEKLKQASKPDPSAECWVKTPYETANLLHRGVEWAMMQFEQPQKLFIEPTYGDVLTLEQEADGPARMMSIWPCAAGGVSA